VTDNRTVLVEFSPSGGLFQFAAQLGAALADRGEHVELWTGPDPEITSEEARFLVRSVLPTWHPNDNDDAGGRLHYLLRRGTRAGRLVLAWLTLAVKLRRRPPRAVLFSQWRFTFEPWFVVAICKLLPRTVFAIVAHEPLPRSDAKDTSTPKQGHLLQASFAAAWRHMDAAFVLGPRTRQIVMEHWRPSCDVVVIPHGDSGVINRGRPVVPVTQTEPIALFFGTWTTYKGIDVLIEAFRRVKTGMPTARLVIAGAIGADVNGPELIAKAAAVGAETRPGYCAMDEVQNLFDSARVVVTPYIRASASGVAHLAYTFGRPVIGTTVGDLPAAIEDEVTGLLVPPNDPAMLATAILKLLQNPQSAATLGEAGRAAVQRSWAVAAAAISNELTAATELIGSTECEP
jgi:glycosyltransferase involved in cell wall biosynthesis